VAIHNARSYSSEQRRRVELEQAVRALEAMTTIARALGGETDLDRILELIVKQARALLDARNVVLQLAGLKVLLSGARRRAQLDVIDTALGQAIGQIEDSIGELRRLIADLRPATLDDLGLAPAVEALVERVSQTSGLKTTARIELGALRFPTALEDTAYRLVQEALTNVVKHAGASEVAVTLAREDGAVLISVADDGVGLHPNRDTDGVRPHRDARACRLAAGTLTITAGRAGTGTLINVRLPSSEQMARAISA
jgi:signal transduction histidine kinase